jgi:hypothetical protein
MFTLPSFGHCIVSGAITAYSSFFWPVYCKNGRVSSSCSRDNTMAKRRKSKQLLLQRQYYGQKTEEWVILAPETIQWSNNCLLFRLLASVLSLEHELLTLPSFGHSIVSGAITAYSSVFWPVYCLWSSNYLLFHLLAIVFSLEQELLTLPSFGHCIVSGPRNVYSSPKDGRVSSYCSRDNTMAKRRKSKQFLLQRQYTVPKMEE